MTPLQALYGFRVVYVVFIVYASLATLLTGWPAGHGSPSAGMARLITGLASAEILAALGFLWLPAQRWAGAALILIFAIATLIDLAHRGVPLRFAYYAATVVLLVFLDARLRELSPA